MGIRARYLLLCALFGALVGLRYTLDVWVLTRLAPEDSAVLILVAASFIGMLLGEVAAPQVSDHYNRSAAITAAAGAQGCWALLTIGGIAGNAPSLLYAAGLAFGIGLGLYHASLDAWLDEAWSQKTDGLPATDRHLTEGYLLYNLGYLGAATLAFPLLYGPPWNASLDLPGLANTSFAPYLLALGLAGGAILLRPPRLPNLSIQHPDPRKLLAFPLREYLAVLRYGRTGLLVAVTIGACTNLLFQYIDYLAPAKLLPGSTIADRALNIFAFNLTVVLMVSALGAYLAWRFPTEKLTPKQRAFLIAAALCLSLSLGAAAITGPSPAIPLLLGLAQSILLALPPLVKSWMLDYAVGGLRATALSLLGIAKRSLGIGATLGLFLASQHGSSKELDNLDLFIALTGIGGFCVLILVVYALSRSRPK
ncbi:hypothetical protein Noc_1296 [Nitrosococcus oceani ATCC 19707]|uniref:Uncharacterized protein n=2 Tax=Nitrosococcus oceani TaxID=1229 RepID=Q3JBK1_NITOC|nr:hypothetical protein [Nitrosococcus oceani]ABA57795.1 hypothetical protein Noc_1296 [Nitrosococcus oceani ATCC 19707]EDZ67867.1 hypothetical protein NOC27_1194 [Nitrosococcus oceani AFC27]KFI19778.1 hypothetical protein IB75_06750 [Nitrosococcus oceani C-27]GEM21674.1 hypothetical protein NONS58_31240 [Nitrosococcus oceani]